MPQVWRGSETKTNINLNTLRARADDASRRPFSWNSITKKTFRKNALHANRDAQSATRRAVRCVSSAAILHPLPPFILRLAGGLGLVVFERHDVDFAETCFRKSFQRMRTGSWREAPLAPVNTDINIRSKSTVFSVEILVTAKTARKIYVLIFNTL